MKNRHDDTPVISDYTYYVFERIEERGLQFAIPDAWRPLYRAFLRKRKALRAEVAAYWSESAHGPITNSSKGTETPQESSKANNTTGSLED